MSALSDSLAALKNVVLMQERLESMRSEQRRIAEDVSGLADMVAAVRDRVARLEGIIEGAAMASRARSELPKE
jgi:predicted nuclease with TOPRIM domain